MTLSELLAMAALEPPILREARRQAMLRLMRRVSVAQRRRDDEYDLGGEA